MEGKHSFFSMLCILVLFILETNACFFGIFFCSSKNITQDDTKPPFTPPGGNLFYLTYNRSRDLSANLSNGSPNNAIDGSHVQKLSFDNKLNRSTNGTLPMQQLLSNKKSNETSTDASPMQQSPPSNVKLHGNSSKEISSIHNPLSDFESNESSIVVSSVLQSSSEVQSNRISEDSSPSQIHSSEPISNGSSTSNTTTPQPPVVSRIIENDSQVGRNTSPIGSVSSMPCVLLVFVGYNIVV